ncbi:hypothetical protein [Flavobacterium suaedae]|nr:hypothetical protein [Flavobacterium suaedae]
MRSFLIKFLVSLIILLSGGAQLNAHTEKDMTPYSSIKSLEEAEQINLGLEYIKQDYTLKSSSPVTEKQGDKIYATDSEIEEDEVPSYKKHVKSSKYFITDSYSQTHEYFCDYTKRRLAIRKRFFYFSSYKWYIIFRVFRI